MVEFRTPSKGGCPHTLVITDDVGTIWLPSSNVGIRKMVVDASGKLWYMGSHNGRLGVVE